MQIEVEDFNNAEAVFSQSYSAEWEDLLATLTTMRLHLKASDQDGLQGTAIFDPVGTNRAIGIGLGQLGWAHNLRIPEEYSFLGTDVDFGKGAVIVEAQFSNYPFLLNNVLRSELFFKARVTLADEPTAAVVVITKAHMFPASNSTLYYEQALRQLSSLAKYRVFDVPIRLVGLFESRDANVDTRWTEYHRARYSRTVISQTDRICRITSGREGSRCRLDIADGDGGTFSVGG